MFKALQESADALTQFLEACQEADSLSSPLCLAVIRGLSRWAICCDKAPPFVTDS